MKTYNISRIPDGFSQPTYEEILLSGYTQGYEDGYNRGTEECKPFNERYFTIESRVEGIVTVPDRVDYYRRNFQEWIAVPSGGTLVDVGPGDTVEMKGLNDNCEALFTGATMPDEYIAYGNILSLVYGDDFADKYRIAPEGSPIVGQFTYAFAGNTGLTDASNLVLQATALTRYCYAYMFSGCTSLETAPVLPATTLVTSCYESMFQGCTSLTAAPELPATTLTIACYRDMFNNCSSLTTAPELPATTLAPNCYYNMFQGCTSLTTAPVLSATTLAVACYGGMFEGCTNLTTAPVLPATALTSGCYQHMFWGCESLAAAPALPATALTTYCYTDMFYGCTSLTTAPELPATSLVQFCYDEMFRGCSRLNYIKCLATDISANNCTRRWVYGVAANGTFTKASSATWGTGVSGIPEGWTIQDA